MNNIRVGQLKPAVAMIVFRRPDLTKKVLDAVADFAPSQLFVIADGPRKSRPLDQIEVNQTRALFDDLAWPCDVIKIYSNENLGLRQRVISGLDAVFSVVDSVIILEDDCLPSEDFFEFNSQMLSLYEFDPRVGLISGNNFAPRKNISNSYYFSRHANIWGWATWRRTWLSFRESRPLANLTREESALILDRVVGRSTKKSFGNLLNKASQLDSWAIQFAAFIYLNRLSSITPGQNLVTNVGFGAGSTHTKFESWADDIPLGKMNFPLDNPGSTDPDISEMQRESRLRRTRWVTYPLLHPVDAAKRIHRYLRLLSN